MRLVVIAILLLNGMAWGQAPAPPASWVKVPEVLPPPAPAPTPGSVPRLEPEALYVLDCSEPCFILVSPPGIVAVSQDAGPIKIRGKFVGGSGKYETRTFTGKMVFTVEAVGSGRVELLVVKEGAKSAADVFRQLLDANLGPLPPPVPPVPPIPPKPDPPKPDPAPIPAPGLRVLMLTETKNPILTVGQKEVLFSAKVRDHLDRVCANENGWPGYRIYDPTQTVANDFQVWRDVMVRVTTGATKHKELPWLVISNPGKGGYEGPVPEGAAKFLELLKRFE